MNPPMSLSEAFIVMWKGMDQSWPLSIGATDSLAFKISKAFWQDFVHYNFESFASNLNIGATILVKFSIKQG